VTTNETGGASLSAMHSANIYRTCCSARETMQSHQRNRRFGVVSSKPKVFLIAPFNELMLSRGYSLTTSNFCQGTEGQDRSLNFLT
jgi:hypothetical protein